MDLLDSATGLAEAIARREISPLEALDACLEQIDRANPALNAVIWRDDDQARADARHLGDLMARGSEELGPFAGVPLPIKDLTHVAGQPATYGSRGASDEPRAEDDLVVAALRRAGFVLCGRTNTPELGPIPVAENLRYGITRNPWDLDRTPGGSSGGAAAAVAAGMFPVAHANDGGGSIRIPASCCGLVGLKPSRGRVRRTVAGWFGAVVEGVVSHSVLDTAAVLDTIAEPDPLAWVTAPAADRPFAQEVGADTGRLRIALMTDAPLGLATAEAPRRAVAAAGQLLTDLGHQVEPATFDLFPPETLVPFLSIVNAGLAEYDIDFAKAEPHIAADHRAAQAVDSLEVVRAFGVLQQMARRLGGRWGRDFDVLVTPTMSIEPPPAGTVLEAAHANPDGPAPDVVAMTIFTAPFNVSGQPAISLPLHWSDAGLPVGVQLVAGPWQDGLLVRLAAQLETAAPWSSRRPPWRGPGRPAG
ncbi:MAG TPA: amidase [Acidimicrobiales bacterium]|nr:amidase [Acidimicrobiales bacterium]